MKTTRTLIAAIGLAATLARGEVYDVSTQFDPSNNPTASGLWRYGSQATLGGTFALYTNRLFVNGIDFWQMSSAPRVEQPLVLESQYATTTTNAYRDAILPGDQFALHPGPTGDYSVARLTLPAIGTFAVAAIFTGFDTNTPVLADVHVLVNDVAIFNGLVIGYLGQASLTTTRVFSAGDRIDFAVGKGGDTFNNDTIGLNATISRVVSETTPPVITISATPAILWPPSRKLKSVTVSGQITDAGVGVAAARYAVVDEYGTMNSLGNVALNPDGTYSFVVNLSSKRKGSDKDGRHYTIFIGAEDFDGNHADSSVTVVAPHDMRH
jgi:hypothetical protein